MSTSTKQISTEGDEKALEERMTCIECVGDPYLKALINSEGSAESCSYCGKTLKTLPLSEIATHVERAIDEHYGRTAIEPEGLEYYLSREGGYDRPGDPIVDVLEEEAEVSREIAEDLRAVLFERQPWDSSMAGSELDFDEDALYQRNDVIDHSKLSERFERFEKLVKEEARFFSPETRQILGAIFNNLDQHRTRSSTSAIVEVGPEAPIKGAFRARSFQSTEELEAALSDPSVHLGPPPRMQGAAGRMNAAGVSVFYGALDVDTALAEIRPPVGSKVAVAEFRFTRPLRLLDVEALRQVFVKGTIFDPEYLPRLQSAAFLDVLSYRFSQPIMPDHAASEYIATQAIADYLANEIEPPLDGILYPSAQAGGGRNVILFNKASRVTEIELPKGTSVRSYSGYADEDGFNFEYTVYEEVPVSAKEEAASRKPAITSIDDDFANWSPDSSVDPRVAALAVDTNSIVVHHIDGVAFKTVEHKVSRSRVAKRERKY